MQCMLSNIMAFCIQGVAINRRKNEFLICFNSLLRCQMLSPGCQMSRPRARALPVQMLCPGCHVSRPRTTESFSALNGINNVIAIIH